MTRRRRARDGGFFCHSEERRLLSFRGAERRGIWSLSRKRDQIPRFARDDRTAEGSGWRRLRSSRGAAFFCHSEERRLLSFRGAERRGIWAHSEARRIILLYASP